MCAWRMSAVAAVPYTFIVLLMSVCRMSRCCTPTGVPTASSHDRCVRRNVCELMLPMRALNAAFREVSATLPHRGDGKRPICGQAGPPFRC